MGFACIDIGTVTCRLALWSDDPAHLDPQEKHSTICDLGRGVDATGRLREDRVAAVVGCVRDYVGRAVAAGHTRVVCTCTSAARDAANAADLLDPLRAMGLEPQVIPGRVEGELTFMGVTCDMPGERVAVADSGGGSTEVALGRADENQTSVEWVHSFDLGCRRMADRFGLGEGPVAPATLHEAHRACEDVFATLPWVSGTAEPPARLAAVGGTVTTLVAVRDQLVPYDPTRVHLATLTLEDIERLEVRMSALAPDELRNVAGLQPQRAPVILGGVVVVGSLMRAAGANELTVSEGDLLRGLAMAVRASLAGTRPEGSWRPCLKEVRVQKGCNIR